MKRALAILLLFIALLTVSARAEDASDIGLGTYGIFRDVQDNRYIIQDDRIQHGIVHYRHNWYYAYKTSRPGKPRGSLCECAFRMYGHNKWRYHKEGGAALKQSNRYITIDDYTKYVKYIYVPGTNWTQRYNCKSERYEIRKNRRSRKWREVGMQFYWEHDRQK